MAAVRETVLGAFRTQLAANVGAGYTVERNRKDAVTASGTLVVEDGGQQRDDDNSAEDRYRMRVRVWGYLEAPDGGDGEDVGERISEAHAAIVKAITSDPTLGGAADYVTEADMDDPLWDQEPGTRDNAAFSVNFTVEFVTRVGDPTQAP